MRETKDNPVSDGIAGPALLLAGAVLVVAAAAPYRQFDLDRFLAPKEIALHAAALTLALLGLRRVKVLELSLTDLLLAAYLALSAVSALFAPDHWLATRALAITLSGAAVFWAARAAAAAGGRRIIVAGLAAAGVIGAAISLAQAYGLDSSFFSPHRVPGGTFGNRNFMAHLAAICSPALVLATLAARRSWAAALGYAGMAVLAAALVLSRSRAAYLGLVAGAAILAYGAWRAHGRWNDKRNALRMLALALAAAVGMLGALLLPNRLEWKSRSPYLDTVAGMVNYQEGSGHGRLVQYGRTLRMAAAHPLLGAGPGNWAVVYPKFSEYYDPSIDYFTGTTINPWPSSDWVAIAAERGVPALTALLLALFALLAGGWRRAIGASASGEYMEDLALAATLVVTGIVATFDAVLLLPAPAFICWALFGALAAPSAAHWSVALSPPGRRRLLLGTAIVGAAAVLRSAGQVGAMAVYGRARTAAQVTRAHFLDPGNARIAARYAALKGRRSQGIRPY